MKLKSPRCVIIAGPNGAGKTTFAREFLPLQPRAAAFAAGKLLLRELDRLARARVSFAFEST